MARTAVVAGTATAVSNRVSRRQARRWSDQDAPAYMAQSYSEPPPQQYAEPAPAPPPPAPTESRIDKLKELGELKAQGVLTDAEFEAEKARILAG
ncbi:MAG TPA: SHOCT domain-containing protein [Thermoleophilaceae bacterium]|jgi:hypothetical protein